MMIGSALGLRPRAQPAAELDAGQAGQHPVEHDEIGRGLAQRGVGLVAARDGLDLVALGFEIVAQQQRQRLLVLDDQDAWRPSSRLLLSDHGAARCGERRGVALRPLLGDRRALDHVIDGLGDVGGVVAHALDVLGAEQQMGAEA